MHRERGSVKGSGLIWGASWFYNSEAHGLPARSHAALKALNPYPLLISRYNL